MSDQTNDSVSKFDREAEALMALEKARVMPRGRSELRRLKKQGRYRTRPSRNVSCSINEAGLRRPNWAIWVHKAGGRQEASRAAG
jgi:hypothetical protein